MQTTRIPPSEESGLGSMMMSSKKMNPIKINPYRQLLRRLIPDDLSADTSNTDRFLLQTIWANDFPISYQRQANNEISADISADSANI